MNENDLVALNVYEGEEEWIIYTLQKRNIGADWKVAAKHEPQALFFSETTQKSTCIPLYQTHDHWPNAGLAKDRWGVWAQDKWLTWKCRCEIMSCGMPNGDITTKVQEWKKPGNANTPSLAARVLPASNPGCRVRNGKEFIHPGPERLTFLLS